LHSANLKRNWHIFEIIRNNGITEERKEGTMATGKKALDIFTQTTGKRADIGVEVAERIEGRPRAAEPYQKVTVTLYERQIIALDMGALVIRERTGQAVSRAELIRAVLTAGVTGARRSFRASLFTPMFAGIS
jgi:hypothetical protein